LLQRGAALGSTAFLLSACDNVTRLIEPAAPTIAAPATAAPRAGGTLHISIPGDLVARNVPFALTPADLSLYTLIYDSLVSYDTNLNPQPRLATAWQWSPNADRLMLTLRSGVTFHSGRPFTSDDVKFTLEHLRDPAVGSNWRNYANLMHITTPDPTTVVIDYDTPVPSSFDALVATYIADPQSLDDTNAGRGFVGTGPFRFGEWSPGDHFTARRNPTYWQSGKPYLDQVELRVMPDQQTGLVALETGRVDWMSGVPGQDARRLQSDPNYQTMATGAGGTFYYVGLDLAVPALADQRVRQAFNYALNRDRMVDIALNGFGRRTAIPWPRQSLGFDAAQDQSYRYDLNMARQLLSAAGWNPDTTVPLLIPNTLAATRGMAQIYQSDMAAVGVNLSVQETDLADLFPRLVNGQVGGAWMWSMAFMNLSPATFLNSALPVRTQNPSHFTSQRYLDLVNQITAEPDPKKLNPLLHETTQIMLDESFIAPIAESTGLANGLEVARSSVHNAVWNIFGLFAYEDIWLGG
jgi:peptide/nickel transport system substrate-binding protein